MNTAETHSTSSDSTTMVLQIGTSWAVCTRTAVPVILARFAHRQEAIVWQRDHETRVTARAA